MHLQHALSQLGFSALVFVANLPSADVRSLFRACRKLAIKAITIEQEDTLIAERFASHQFPVYLIRPDEHIAARFSPTDAGRLTDAHAVATGRAKRPMVPAGNVRMSSATEAIYEALCNAIDDARGADDETALERIALTFANEIGDAERVRGLIEAALDAGRTKRPHRTP